jgi:hypothetical protein
MTSYRSLQIRVLLDELAEFLFERGGHLRFGQAMFVRQLDDLSVAFHVLQAGGTITEVRFQFVLGLLV